MAAPPNIAANNATSLDVKVAEERLRSPPSSKRRSSSMALPRSVNRGCVSRKATNPKMPASRMRNPTLACPREIATTILMMATPQRTRRARPRIRPRLPRKDQKLGTAQIKRSHSLGQGFHASTESLGKIDQPEQCCFGHVGREKFPFSGFGDVS